MFGEIVSMVQILECTKSKVLNEVVNLHMSYILVVSNVVVNQRVQLNISSKIEWIIRQKRKHKIQSSSQVLLVLPRAEIGLKKGKNSVSKKKLDFLSTICSHRTRTN